MKRVVVVGSGIAGTAATLAARNAGADVTMVAGSTGATTLSPGALDGPDLDEASQRVLAMLGGYAMPQGGAVLATTAGTLRIARGVDCALLDLAALKGGVVFVPAVDHPSYDGELFARSWAESSLARELSLSFSSRHVSLTRHSDEHSLPDPDLAGRHDDPERLAWLAERLIEATKGDRPAAILLPPWLGLVQPRAEALSRRVGIPCGEALSGPGGPSGLRFERARDRAVELAHVTVLRQHARKVERVASEWRVELEGDRDYVLADAVVLAMGGLVGGGLAYTPAGSVLASALPPRALAVACVTLDAPVTLAAFHRPLDTPGSLYGGAPESHAWPGVEDPLLDHVGIAVDDMGRVAGTAALFAAGELVADRPRTWLEALSGGTRVGAAAANPGT